MLKLLIEFEFYQLKYRSKRVSHKIQKRFQYEESTKHTEKTEKIQQKVLFFENLLGIVLLCQLSRTSSGEYYFNDFIVFQKK